MRTGLVLASVLVLGLLLCSSPALADSQHGSHQNGGDSEGQGHSQSSLSLMLQGAILDVTSENYYHQGGHLVGAYILGVPVDPSSADVRYSLRATVTGLSVKGSASFSLTIHNPDGSKTFVNGATSLDAMVPAEPFPLGCTTTPPCTSAIPGVFNGTGSVTEVTCQGSQDNGHGFGQDGKCGSPVQLTLPMFFESAFLNPFGGPIVMGSNDGEFVIVATYSQAFVTWKGIQLGGTASGTLDGSPASGYFGMQVSAFEDLRAGFEIDAGTIAFTGMTPGSLNAQGHFVGRSTIPAGTPCDPSFGFPPGTCQITGFASAGAFLMTNGKGASIVGHYSTAWIAPAVAFVSKITASLNGGH